MNPIFTGSFCALVTPFRNGQVDEAKLRELVDMHAASGTDGLVPCGTTGEAPTLSHDEHRRVIEIVVDANRKRMKILPGTGVYSTRDAIELTAQRLYVRGGVGELPEAGGHRGSDPAIVRCVRVDRFVDTQRFAVCASIRGRVARAGREGEQQE